MAAAAEARWQPRPHLRSLIGYGELQFPDETRSTSQAGVQKSAEEFRSASERWACAQAPLSDSTSDSLLSLRLRCQRSCLSL